MRFAAKVLPRPAPADEVTGGRAEPAPPPATSLEAIEEGGRAEEGAGDRERIEEGEEGAYPWLYHEQQVRALCAVHSLNNLLQGPYYDEDALRQVTQELDQAERALLEGQGLDEGNARTDGYFNVQVMQVLLDRAGFEMRPYRSTWPAPDGMDPASETAFILNRRMHWFTVLKVRGQWFDLNSRLSRPQPYSETELRAQLSGFMASGWTVFVVRGDFDTVWGEALPNAAASCEAKTKVRCTRTCVSTVCEFVAYWFNGRRFEPACFEPLAGPFQVADPAACSAEAGAACDAADGGGADGADAASGAPPPPPSPPGEMDSTGGRQPPAAPPPQLEGASAFAEPELDLHFRLDDGPGGRRRTDNLPKCPRDHELKPLGRTRDNGWSCDGTSYKGGCRVGVGKRGMTARMNRFRCELCDYDLCELCYKSWHEPIVLPDAERRRPGGRTPIVTVTESITILLLWVISIARIGETDIAFSAAGWDTLSPFEGLTGFALHSDCTDLRPQAWRWLTYRFTHTSAPHVVGSCILLIIFGVPLETLHGAPLVLLYVNIGCATGAAFHGVLDGHTELLGTSAVVYTFIGMHLADLILNWRVGSFRVAVLLLILLSLCLDLLALCWLPLWGSSFSGALAADRIGGFVAGLCLGCGFARTLWSRRARLALKVLSGVTLAVLVAACVTWVAAQWPPKRLGHTEAWCWSRRLVLAEGVTTPATPSAPVGECVRCGDQACIEYWRGFPGIAVAECDEDLQRRLRP